MDSTLPHLKQTEQRLESEKSVVAAKSRRHSKMPVGWELANEILQARLDRFIGYETQVLKGNDPEAIHDFRVASRRLQQAFDLLYPLPRAKRAKKLRRVIQRSRSLLSTIRNCDVLLEHTEAALKKTRTSHNSSWRAFRDYLLSQRTSEFSKATDQLTRLNLSGFFLKMQGFLKEHPSTATSKNAESHANESQAEDTKQQPRFEDRLAGSILRSWETFEENVQKAASERESKNLHAVRISAKKIRYLIEVVSEMKIKESAAILARLKRLQQLLGDWHDMEVMEDSMAEMLARPKFLRANLQLAIDTEKLMLSNRVQKNRLEKRYFEMAAESGELSELRAEIGNLVSQPPLFIA